MASKITKDYVCNNCGAEYMLTYDEDNILEDSERLLKKYHDKSDGSFNQIALAPCSPFSVSEELMVSTATG